MPLENENKVVNDIRDEPVNEIVAEPIEEIAAQKSIDQDVLKKGKKELNDGEDRVDIFWLWSSSWLPSLFWFALGSGFSSTGATPTKVVQIVQIQKDLLHLPILTRVDTKRFRIQQQMQLCMSILNFAVYTTHEFCWLNWNYGCPDPESKFEDNKMQKYMDFFFLFIIFSIIIQKTFMLT